jgi:hypothetical protein
MLPLEGFSIQERKVSRGCSDVESRNRKLMVILVVHDSCQDVVGLKVHLSESLTAQHSTINFLMSSTMPCYVIIDDETA